MWENRKQSAITIILLFAILRVNSLDCLVQHCQICLTPYNCTQCIDGFYAYIDGTCQSCSDPLCRICPNNPRCQDCRSGFYLRSVDNSCRSCQELNCLNCASSGNCSKCFEGFFLQPIGTSMVCK